MNKFKILGIIFISLLLSVNLYAQTVYEIIEKHIEALGGMDNIKAVKTMKIVGSVKMMGMELPFTSYNVVPDKVYFEISVQGKSIKQAYDGMNAWTINPMSGSTLPEKVEGDDAMNIKEKASIFDKLVSYKDDGASVELKGKEKVNDTEVFNVQYTGSDGKIVNYYLNSDDFMIVKVQKKIKVRDTEMDSESFYSNYKKVDNVMMTFTFEVKVKNSPIWTQEVIIDKIIFNQPVDESIFSMPSK